MTCYEHIACFLGIGSCFEWKYLWLIVIAAIPPVLVLALPRSRR